MLSVLLLSLGILASTSDISLLAEALTCHSQSKVQSTDRFTLLMNARLPDTGQTRTFDLLLSRQSAVTQLVLVRAFRADLANERGLTQWEFQSEAGDRVVFSRTHTKGFWQRIESQILTVQLQYTPVVEYQVNVTDKSCANLLGFTHLLERALPAQSTTQLGL